MNVKSVYPCIAFSVSFSPLNVLISFYEYKVLNWRFQPLFWALGELSEPIRESELVLRIFREVKQLTRQRP